MVCSMLVKITEIMRVELGIPWSTVRAWTHPYTYKVEVDSRCLRRYKRKWLKAIRYERRHAD